jgi:outer membrane biosynthesis protein TonB
LNIKKRKKERKKKKETAKQEKKEKKKKHQQRKPKKGNPVTSLYVLSFLSFFFTFSLQSFLFYFYI